jgi:hypothetical protein
VADRCSSKASSWSVRTFVHGLFAPSSGNYPFDVVNAMGSADRPARFPEGADRRTLGECQKSRHGKTSPKRPRRVGGASNARWTPHSVRRRNIGRPLRRRGYVQSREHHRAPRGALLMLANEKGASLAARAPSGLRGLPAGSPQPTFVGRLKFEVGFTHSPRSRLAETLRGSVLSQR